MGTRLRGTAAIVAVALLFGSCFAGGIWPDEQTVRSKADSLAAPSSGDGFPGPHPLGLADEDFWGDYTRTQEETHATIKKTGYRGILIDIPRVISVNNRNTIPVVGWYVRTIREESKRSLEGQTVVAVVNLQTGGFVAAPALHTGKHGAPPVLSPDEDSSEGIRLEMFETDLRRVFDLPWEPGRYAVFVILQDFISNVATTELTGGAATAPSRPDRPASVRPSLGDASDLPDYHRRQDSPAVPLHAGIILSAEPQVRIGAQFIVRGSFRLPLLPQERVTRGEAVGAPGARAVLSISLLATGTDDPGPFEFRLSVPSYSADGDEATGHFAVDLSALKGAPVEPMTYYVHALSRDVAAVPVSVRVVAQVQK